MGGRVGFCNSDLGRGGGFGNGCDAGDGAHENTRAWEKESMCGIEGADVMGQLACTEDESLERGDAGDRDGGNGINRCTSGRGISDNKTDTARLKPGDRMLQQTATHSFKTGDVCRARYHNSPM